MQTESKASYKNVQEEVTKILAKVLDIDLNTKQITLESDLTKDLRGDSLQIVEAVMAMEDKFDVEISDSEAAKMKTVGDVVKYIDGAVSKKTDNK